MHFCPEAARLAGSPDIIVHGMLPMVSVKQAIADAFLESATQAQWLKVACRFRSPIRRDQAHSLTIAGGSFVLHAAPGGREVLLGNFEPLGECASGGMVVGCIELPESEVRERLSRFSASLPEVDSLWIAADSLVFSKLIANDASLPIIRGRRLTQGASTHSELLERVIALQTAHSVVVSRWLLSRPLSGMPPLDAIRIELAAPQIVRDTPALLVGSQPAHVFIGTRLAMRCEIGFLFKRMGAALATA